MHELKAKEAVVMEIKTDQAGIQKTQGSSQSQRTAQTYKSQELLTSKLVVGKDSVTLNSQKSVSDVTYNQDLSINSAADKGYDQLRTMVLSMFEEQGLDYKISTGDSEIDMSTLSAEEAQALIADDGYFGVAQTSDRIVDFAIAVSGDDPTRLDAILQGIEQGFNEAKDAFGGTLPDISYETYDAIQDKLDNWANGLAGNSES